MILFQGTPGVGGQYEINVSAYFALKLNLDKAVKDFSIQSNNENFGNFDDVVIDVTMENGDSLNFAIQLKHSERERKLYPGAFEATKKTDFSLQNYCASFKNISSTTKDKCRYIIYTCQNFDENSMKDVKEFDMLEDDQCPGNRFFDTSSGTRSTYKFQVNRETLKRYNRSTEITRLDYKIFFSKFTLYTNQRNIHGFEKLILDILKEQNVVNSYLTLFRKWHQGFFTNKTIDRKTINNHLVDIYLSASMITDYRLSNSENEKAYLFERATKEFDATVIDQPKENLKPLEVPDSLSLKSSEISNLQKYKNQYKIDPSSTLTKCLLRLAQEYKFVDKTATDLDKGTKNKMFCLFCQNLLIVDFNRHSAQALYNLMEVYTLEEDKIRLILLGRGADLSKLSSLQVFHNLEDLAKKNDQLYREMTMQCTISLQGRSPLTLNQLLGSLGDGRSVVETKELAEMLKTDYRIGKEKIQLPQHYVPRNLSTTAFDLDTILTSSHEGKIIVMVNFEKPTERNRENEAIRFVEISEYVANEESFSGKSIVLTSKEPNPAKEIDAIFAGASQKSVHVFKAIAEDTFIMIRSSSKFAGDSTKTPTFSQEDVHSVFDSTRTNLLVAEPGMGKSTFMKYLRNESSSSFWPIYTDLKSHADFFDKVRTSEQALKHFTKMESSEESAFEKKLKNIFKERKKVILFLDGLDEVPNRLVENVLDTIDNLSREGNHVWVSSRPNLQELLLARFKLLSLRIVEFSGHDQRKYMQDRLNSVYQPNEIARIVDRIFDGIRICNNTRILGIPLQLYILTQIFLDEKKASKDIPESFFVLTKLYRCFFEGRFTHSLAKFKLEPDYPLLMSATKCLKRYEIVALKSVLPKDGFRKLNLSKKQDPDKLKRDPLGIIVGVEQGRAIFEHQTFAEYFACVWFKNNQEKVKLLKDELFSGKYEHLRLMLNIIMAEDNPLHLSIIYRNLEQFEKHCTGEDIFSTDVGGRTALHIACCSNEEGAPGYLTMLEILFEKRSTVADKDGLFQYDWLDYACASRRLYPIEVALRKKLIEFSICKQTVYQYYEKEAMAIQCVALGYPSLLKEIFKEDPTIVYAINGDVFEKAMKGCYFKESAERYDTTFQILIDHSVLDENRALLIACKFNQFEMVKRLLEKGAPGLDTGSMDTALHWACRSRGPNEDVINLLIERDFRMYASNRNGTTPFHLACKYRHVGVVEKTLEQEKLVDSDHGGSTAVHYAARNNGDNSTIISLLIRRGIDINTQNIMGRTPLHEASCKSFANTSKLLEMEAKTTIVDSRGDTALEHLLGSDLTREEKLKMTDLFISHGYDMGGEGAQRTLNGACERGDLFIVETLISKGAKPEYEALHCALKSGNVNKEVIIFLLTYLDVNARDGEGRTALHVACRAGVFENVKVLLDARADVNGLDCQNRNAFDYALELLEPCDILKLLTPYLRRATFGTQAPI